MRPPTFEETIEALEENSLSEWPIKIQTQALLEITRFGDQPLEHAFENNLLSSINHLLTEDWLTTLNEDGFAPIHFLAEDGLLHKIPKEFLTEESLLTPDDKGRTPLYYAAREGHLAQIPIRLPLNTLKLLLKDLAGNTLIPTSSLHWIEKEIKKHHQENLSQSLQNSNHPAV